MIHKKKAARQLFATGRHSGHVRMMTAEQRSLHYMLRQASADCFLTAYYLSRRRLAMDEGTAARAACRESSFRVETPFPRM